MFSDQVEVLKAQGFSLMVAPEEMAISCMVLKHEKSFHFAKKVAVNDVKMNFNAAESFIQDISVAKDNMLFFPMRAEYWKELPFYIISEDKYAEIKKAAELAVALKKERKMLTIQYDECQQSIKQLIAG